MSEVTKGISVPMPLKTTCVNCGKLSMLTAGPISFPVKVRIFFLITFTAKFSLEYCPNCGHFSIFPQV